ncbi:MAG: DNA mismatch repair protein MutS, partial [Bacilli bacterium]
QQAINASGIPILKEYVKAMDDCHDVLSMIEEAIVDDPPISVREGGMIKDGYHPLLDQYKMASTNGKTWLAELEQKERERTKIRTLKIGYNKVFGYYIEVTKANIVNLPEGLYERKQTLANAERYVTQELKEKEALILDAEEKMVSLEYEILLEMRENVANHITRLQNLANQLAYLDVIHAFTKVSMKFGYSKPRFVEERGIHIKAGRHPVVESMVHPEPFIPNDTVLPADRNQILLITGPNMAGKSTYMRQVAINVIMAQMGCFVPAEAVEMSIV